MADEEEPQCKVEYLDLPEGAEPEETNWIRRAGKAKVTYPNGHIFEGKSKYCANHPWNKFYNILKYHL